VNFGKACPDPAIATRPVVVASAPAGEASMKRDVYAAVSTRIIAELEAGAAP